MRGTRYQGNLISFEAYIITYINTSEIDFFTLKKIFLKPYGNKSIKYVLIKQTDGTYPLSSLKTATEIDTKIRNFIQNKKKQVTTIWTKERQKKFR